MNADSLKRAVAKAAALRVRDGMVVGLGSGSTLALVIADIAQRVREERLQIIGIPTSYQARMLAREQGIALRDMMDVDHLDLAIDGADEVDPQGRMIKGAGAAHVQEKIVAAASDRFVVVMDESKLVQRLGERYPCPVEILPIALAFAVRRMHELGLEPQWRAASGKVGPIVSDNGNPIMDFRLRPEHDLDDLCRQLDGIPGVVGHGLFIGFAHELLIARSTEGGAVVERRVLAPE